LIIRRRVRDWRIGTLQSQPRLWFLQAIAAACTLRCPGLSAKLAMIPNLKDLPPIPPPESPLKPLIRPLLAGLLMAAMLGGLIWLYLGALRDTARQDMNVIQGLEDIGSDLWMSGKAAEIRFMEDDLPAEIARLRATVGFSPQIIVMPSEGGAGKLRSTHELVYMKGNRPVLRIFFWVDETEGLVDVVDFQPGSGYEGAPGDSEIPGL
jgi:hypothetical protein